MRKKQKTNKKKQSQRAYKDFITIVKWHKYHFDIISHISNIYENERKKCKISQCGAGPGHDRRADAVGLLGKRRVQREDRDRDPAVQAGGGYLL